MTQKDLEFLRYAERDYPRQYGKEWFNPVCLKCNKRMNDCECEKTNNNV